MVNTETKVFINCIFPFLASKKLFNGDQEMHFIDIGSQQDTSLEISPQQSDTLSRNEVEHVAGPSSAADTTDNGRSDPNGNQSRVQVGEEEQEQSSEEQSESDKESDLEGDGTYFC